MKAKIGVCTLFLIESFSLNGKIKTSIVINEKLWEKFKLKASIERGLKGVSRAVEKALEEELSEPTIAKALENMAPAKPRTPEITPVKPRVKTSAGKAVRELRASRA